MEGIAPSIRSCSQDKHFSPASELNFVLDPTRFNPSLFRIVEDQYPVRAHNHSLIIFLPEPVILWQTIFHSHLVTVNDWAIGPDTVTQKPVKAMLSRLEPALHH